MTSHWQAILAELRLRAAQVPNLGAAQEAILTCRHPPLVHSDEHWEQLGPALHTVLGWNGQGGILNAESSRADFMAIHEFFMTFASKEIEV